MIRVSIKPTKFLGNTYLIESFVKWKDFFLINPSQSRDKCVFFCWAFAFNSDSLYFLLYMHVTYIRIKLFNQSQFTVKLFVCVCGNIFAIEFLFLLDGFLKHETRITRGWWRLLMLLIIRVLFISGCQSALLKYHLTSCSGKGENGLKWSIQPHSRREERTFSLILWIKL